MEQIFDVYIGLDTERPIEIVVAGEKYSCTVEMIVDLVARLNCATRQVMDS